MKKKARGHENVVSLQNKYLIPTYEYLPESYKCETSKRK